MVILMVETQKRQADQREAVFSQGILKFVSTINFAR